MRRFAAWVLAVAVFGCVPVGELRADAAVDDTDSGVTVDSGRPPEPDAGCDGLDFQTDPNNCGGCGKVCAHRPQASAACVSGACTYSCLAHHADCNADLGVQGGNGCEADLMNDPLNCGSCATSCGDSRPNGQAACAAGTCAVQCKPGFLDCNSDLISVAGNGCESNRDTGASSCGECYRACSSTCSAGQCAGETPECRLFSAVGAHPFALSVASDGARTAMAWFDSDNQGLWVALVDAHGATVISPRKLISDTKTLVPALAFDGSSFVLSVVTVGVNQLTLRRLSKASLSDEGAAVSVPVLFSPGVFFGAGSADRAAFLLPTGSPQQVQTVVWRHGQTAPDAPSTLTLPGKALGPVLGFAAVRDGFAALWTAEVENGTSAPKHRRLGVARFNAVGGPVGTMVDPSASSTSLSPWVDLTSVGEGALVWAVEGTGLLRALSLDATGSTQFSWSVVESPYSGVFSLSGDAAGAWLMEKRAAELRFRRVNSAGQPVGNFKRVVTSVSETKMRPLSFGPDAVLGLWSRPLAGVYASVIGSAFLDASGSVQSVCSAP